MILLTSIFGVLKSAWRERGFTATVLLTLALTTGSALAVFALFNAVFLRSYPYSRAEQLVRLSTVNPKVAGSGGQVSLYDGNDWDKRNQSFTATAQYLTFVNNLTGRGPAMGVKMTFAQPALFSILKVRPALGQIYTRHDDQIGGDVRQAVLSDSLWRRVFEADPQIIGKFMQLRGQPYRIVAVMPRGFGYPENTEVWVPLYARYASYSTPWWKERDARPHEMLARLKDGVSLEQAQADMNTVQSYLAKEYPVTDGEIRAVVQSLRDKETGDIQKYVVIVSAAVLLLLAIGCVNVANLFVARAGARQREFALRTALGASFWPIAIQLIGEGLAYSFAGTLLGMGFSSFALHWFVASVPVDLPSWLDLSLDWRLIVFALAMSAAVAVLFGLAPAWQYRNPDLNSVLKQSGKGGAAHSASGRLSSILVVSEVALSMLLLVASLLVLRSFRNMEAEKPGFEIQQLMVVQFGRFLPNATAAEAETGYVNEYVRAVEKVRRLPGVLFVSGGNDMPFQNQPEERPAYDVYTPARATRDRAYRGPLAGADILPGYLRAMHIPLLAGRDFTDADTLGTTKVILINQYTAKLLYPNKNPIGQQLSTGGVPPKEPWLTVVGVVGNTKWNPAERGPAVEVYWPERQYPNSPRMYLMIRHRGPAEALIPAITRAVRSVNPEFAVNKVASMETIAAETLWQRRLWATLISGFAVLAAVLTGVGLFGLLTYLVGQRRRDFGVRMALGVPQGAVLLLVLRQGLVLATIGAFAGTFAALIAMRQLAALLYGLSATSPTAYVGAGGLLIGLACVACVVPAYRATRIDPSIALRDEV